MLCLRDEKPQTDVTIHRLLTVNSNEIFESPVTVHFYNGASLMHFHGYAQEQTQTYSKRPALCLS